MTRGVDGLDDRLADPELLAVRGERYVLDIRDTAIDCGPGDDSLGAGMPNPYALLEMFVADGGDLVSTVACTTTLDMLEWTQDAMDESVTTKFAGAATFLEEVDDADQVFSF